MRAYRVLLVDDNAIFGSQVVAAFAEAAQEPQPLHRVEATWVARGSDALALLDPNRQSGPLPTADLGLIIVDFVRPASGGRQLLEQLQHLRERASLGFRPPQVLVLLPVGGSFADLAAGVEVQVKPIFPSQVVASARRLLGLTPSIPPSGMPRAGAGQVASHQLSLTPAPLGNLPSSGSPATLPGRPIDDVPTAAHVPMAAESGDGGSLLDSFEDSSDFGPADTLLGPSNIEELARAMARSAPTGDDLGDFGGLLSPRSLGLPATPPLPSVRTPTRRQFPALGSPQAESELAEAQTALMPRSGELAPAAALGGSTTRAAGLAGDLAVIPLIDIVALLSRQQQSGVLQVVAADAATDSSGPAVAISIVLRNGRIDQCLASGLPSLRLGHFVAEAAPLGRAQIDELDGSRRRNDQGEPELLGQRLCREGLLRPDELRQIIARQSTELLYEALRWKSGRFTLDPLATPPLQAADAALGGALALDAEALLLEGYRRVRDFHLLAKDGHEGAVYVSTAPTSEPVSRLGLSHGELVVLGLCNGRLAPADIARESHLAELEVTRTLQRLLSLRLVRRRLPALLAS